MNGKRLLLDTNAVISILRGHEILLTLTQSAAWVGISIITYLEFKSFTKLTGKDTSLFKEFLLRVNVVSLRPEDDELIRITVNLRKTHRLKLPDAIIAASALTNHAALVTADKALSRVGAIAVISFTPAE
ncbi:MAG: PIN domain-containing protein [Elusimicrobiota bacterium]|nr:PIN domain-containing protein [Elusimicrobiota bacterium]